jgi:peroxiredoxin
MTWPYPAPIDTGGARHLVPGLPLPQVLLSAGDGTAVDLSRERGLLVVFVYPWTGRPGLANPPRWDEIPGAHGSTPEAEGFRDLHSKFVAQGARVIGLSGQDSAHHRELTGRLRLPFPLLSDEGFRFADALDLPRFETGGTRYLERLTIVARDGRIAKVFHPVHPPDLHAAEVLAWLRAEGR